jgi:hypothetical protein
MIVLALSLVQFLLRAAPRPTTSAATHAAHSLFSFPTNNEPTDNAITSYDPTTVLYSSSILTLADTAGLGVGHLSILGAISLLEGG